MESFDRIFSRAKNQIDEMTSSERQSPRVARRCRRENENCKGQIGKVFCLT